MVLSKKTHGSDHKRAAHRIGFYRDVCVVYPYRHDEADMYIAHSIMSNNIGVGRSPYDAYCQLLYALVSVFKYTPEDQLERVLYNPAPREVVDRYRKSTRMAKDVQIHAIEKVKETWKQKGLKEVNPEALLLDLCEEFGKIDLKDVTGTGFLRALVDFDADGNLQDLKDVG